MKALFIFLILNTCAAQHYFNKAIPSFENNADGILCQALETSSKEIVSFVHSYVYIQNKFGNRFCRLSKEGNVIEFRNNLDSINAELVLNFKKVSSGYLTCGFKLRVRDTMNHFWFAKYNEKFDTVWTKTIQKKYNRSGINNIMELHNKNIGLCGTDMKVRPGGTFVSTIPVVVIADSLGEIIHYTEIRGADTTAGEVFVCITEGLDHSIYASGYIVKLDNLLDNDPIIVKVSPDGELMWRKQITNKGFNEIFNNVFAQKDGSILGIGESGNDYGASKEFTYVLLINFDTDGNINWTKRIFKGNLSDNYNAIQDSQGNIIGTGLYERNKSKKKEGHGWIFKCTATGDSIWSRPIVHAPDSLPERFNNISQAADGGFYLTGYSWIEGDISSKGWIVKTDSFGCVVPGCEKIVSTKDIASGKEKVFVLYPNPVQDHFFFLSRITSSEPMQLMIYNLQGQVVQTYTFQAYEGHQYQVDLKKDIPLGNYLVQIIDGKGRIVCGEKMEILR